MLTIQYRQLTHTYTGSNNFSKLFNRRTNFDKEFQKNNFEQATHVSKLVIKKHIYSSTRNVLTFNLILLRLKHFKYTNSYLNVRFTRFECLLGMKSNHLSEKYSLQSNRPSLPIGFEHGSNNKITLFLHPIQLFSTFIQLIINFINLVINNHKPAVISKS